LLLPLDAANVEGVHVFSKPEILSWIAALIAVELYHLKWIWLSEWTCRRCARKNLDCACPSRQWQKLL
jgi:hypothetical protein